jgi:hypothetical protein
MALAERAMENALIRSATLLAAVTHINERRQQSGTPR